MEGHTLITTADDVCASTQITLRPIKPMMADMKEVHVEQGDSIITVANNVLTSIGTGLMSVRKASQYRRQLSISPVCVFVPHQLPSQAWRAQVAPGLGSCPHQGCQGAGPPSTDIPRSPSEARQAPKTTTNTVSVTTRRSRLNKNTVCDFRCARRYVLHRLF